MLAQDFRTDLERRLVALRDCAVKPACLGNPLRDKAAQRLVLFAGNHLLGIIRQHLDRGQGGAVQFKRPTIRHAAYDQVWWQDRLGLACKPCPRLRVEATQKAQHLGHALGCDFAQAGQPFDIARPKHGEIVQKQREIGGQQVAIARLQA